DTTSFAPTGALALPAGEGILLSVQAAPGASVRLVLPWGSSVPLVPDSLPGEPGWSVRAFVADTVAYRLPPAVGRYAGWLPAAARRGGVGERGRRGVPRPWHAAARGGGGLRAARVGTEVRDAAGAAARPAPVPGHGAGPQRDVAAVRRRVRHQLDAVRRHGRAGHPDAVRAAGRRRSDDHARAVAAAVGLSHPVRWARSAARASPTPSDRSPPTTGGPGP